MVCPSGKSDVVIQALSKWRCHNNVVKVELTNRCMLSNWRFRSDSVIFTFSSDFVKVKLPKRCCQWAVKLTLPNWCCLRDVFKSQSYVFKVKLQKRRCQNYVFKVTLSKWSWQSDVVKRTLKNWRLRNDKSHPYWVLSLQDPAHIDLKKQSIVRHFFTFHYIR